VNELDELTAKECRMIAEWTRGHEGIRNALGRANEADTHALDAGNRADQAQQTRSRRKLTSPPWKRKSARLTNTSRLHKLRSVSALASLP